MAISSWMRFWRLSGLGWLEKNSRLRLLCSYCSVSKKFAIADGS